MNDGAQPQQDPAGGIEHSGRDGQADHGSTGEGASSAMARLISQQQARSVAGAPEDPPTGAA